MKETEINESEKVPLDYIDSEDLLDKIRTSLRSKCQNCFGFCCAALYFSASEGFPQDKEAGQPCNNLQPDFRCKVYPSLHELGLKGCMGYDCFGAGQKVAQVSYGRRDWHQYPDTAQQMFAVFLIMKELHELLWYLQEALTIEAARTIHEQLRSMLEETERLTCLSPEELITLDLTVYRAAAAELIVKAGEYVQAVANGGRKHASKRKKTLGRGADLIGADLRKVDHKGASYTGAYLIAADLRGTDLSEANFLGADMRDADLRGADLSRSIFLTQFQINTAKGDASTKLPSSLTRPRHWE